MCERNCAVFSDRKNSVSWSAFGFSGRTVARPCRSNTVSTTSRCVLLVLLAARDYEQDITVFGRVAVTARDIEIGRAMFQRDSPVFARFVDTSVVSGEFRLVAGDAESSNEFPLPSVFAVLLEPSCGVAVYPVPSTTLVVRLSAPTEGNLQPGWSLLNI